MKTVIIHHLRPGKKEEIFREGFVAEDENGLRTLTIVSPADSQSLTERLIARGFINDGEIIRAVQKSYWYREPFNLLVFLGEQDEVLGYYSDIALPLRKVDDGFELTDLFLDIWVKPDGTLLELDLDEFEEACQKGLLPPQHQELAVAAFARLKAEAKQEKYPHHYLRT